jgi:hypothetical protein
MAAVYRKTRCDRCQKPKSDCIWVAAPSRAEWCLCGDCRRRYREKGVALVNIDGDYPEAAA